MNRLDTTKEAEQVLVGIYRWMPTGIKVRRIFEACQMGKMLAMAGLRRLYPDADEKQIWYLLAKQHLGEKLFKKVYGNVLDE